MSLLKCPKCGEMFSDSYKTCPFCEEDEAFANGGKKPVNPGRRVHRQKSPSILGPTLVLVLVLGRVTTRVWRRCRCRCRWPYIGHWMRVA